MTYNSHICIFFHRKRK